ncbi:hypothetical protein TWF506_000581 [Arthrobotrys conoides]|uniref:Uncharacterized protein n=1 Tax=Arthrobotrys conoides TaxID=74498 RepID=A0AAN8S4C6_9PEZI
MKLPTIPYLCSLESYDRYFSSIRTPLQEFSKLRHSPQPGSTRLVKSSLKQTMATLKVSWATSKQPNKATITAKEAEDCSGWTVLGPNGDYPKPSIGGNIPPGREVIMLCLAYLHAIAIRKIRREFEDNYHYCMGISEAETGLGKPNMIKNRVCPQSATTAEIAKWLSSIPCTAVLRATDYQLGIDDWKRLIVFREYIEPIKDLSPECRLYVGVLDCGRMEKTWRRIFQYVIEDDFVFS